MKKELIRALIIAAIGLSLMYGSEFIGFPIPGFICVWVAIITEVYTFAHYEYKEAQKNKS